MSIQHMQMVFDAGGLTPGEKSVLLAYCNFTDPHGYCWPGVERVADMTGLSERGVKKIRKAFIERGILATASRVNSQGIRSTNITRVNLDKIASMRMPEKTYKDNVVHELGFAETTPDQPTGTECPDPEQPTGTECPDPVNSVPRKDGALSAPYPSGEPSGDPSSSSPEVEDITHEATPTPKKTTKPSESPEEIVVKRTGCTVDEARAVVDYIEAQGDGHGGRIRSLAWWITRREERTLAGDLAHVRRTRATPTATTCGDHQQAMPPHGCDLCAGEIKAGDPDDHARLRAHLAVVGADTRPDLARLLGMPATSASRTPSGYQPYRNPVDQDVYDEALL